MNNFCNFVAPVDFIMDESYKIVLDAHKKKIELLISRYETVLARNRELEDALGQRDAEIRACRENLDNSNNNIKELEQKIDKLQVAGAFAASATDIKEAKQNIGRLVREIDKCISLLND